SEIICHIYHKQFFSKATVTRHLYKIITDFQTIKGDGNPNLPSPLPSPIQGLKSICYNVW
ncbi:MAG: hypothetical protein ACRCZQ_03870, partial [Bacteroidales bacterium]